MPAANPRVGILDPFASPSKPLPVPDQEMGYGIPVFWCGDHPHHEMVDFKDYNFEAHSVKPIYRTMRHQLDERGRLLMDREVMTKLPAEEIVKQLVQKAGKKGLIVRTGNPTVDAERERVGHASWRKWWISECQDIIAAHELACSRAEERKALPPRPSSIWRTAKHDLERLETISDDRKRFVSLKDGLDFDIEAHAIAWVEQTYPGIKASEVIRDLRPGDPKPTENDVPRETEAVPGVHEVVKNTVGADVAIADIYMRAGREGITLPEDLREALKSGDSDILTIALSDARELLDGPTDTEEYPEG